LAHNTILVHTPATQPATRISRQKADGQLYPLMIGIFVFLPLFLADIILCINAHQWYEATGVGIATVLNVSITVAMYYDKKNYHIIPINCFINYCLVSLIVYLHSFSTGICFYYLPVLIVYILYASDIRHKINNSTFFAAISIFIASIILGFLFSPGFQKPAISTTIFVFRFTGTVILSAILLRFFLPVIINKQNLKVRKNYFEALFQSTLDAYIVFDKNTREIIDYNKTTSLLFDLPYEFTIKGLFITQFMMRYLSDRSVNLETIVNDIPGEWQGEGLFRTHTKREFPGYISSVTYSKEEREYQIICIRDITNTKEPEKVIEAYKESLESSTKVKTRFLSSVSHELRTPLNGIIGTTNLILEDKSISEKTKEQLKLQLYSSEHMLSIINDILDFSKIESGKMELHNHSFNLLENVQNLLGTFTNQFNIKKIDLLFDLDPALSCFNIVSDDVKLKQVLNNLISNSLKFTIDGNVSLSVKIEKDGPDETEVAFCVADTGIGINKEKQAEIFEGFVQVHADDLKRRFGGTGLGLAISQKLVNLLGGNITVNSEIGKGASFNFILKFKKQMIVAEAEGADEGLKEAVDIRGIRILVVEDNEINVTVLKAFLNRWNIRIMEAANGLQALELIKYHKFDLILMDLEMPEMNGYTATRIIRETDTLVPVIAFTATMLEDMETLITENGFNDYILKPFKPADLKKKIEKYSPHRKIEYA
jgi:signal transduction histidine kinase/ActR/RegA family two-component response regulator